jgi:hypothetical protein
MLPLGRKNARKCSECDITCHETCAHLVPDFCGMSMETANQLLRDWRDINKARGGKAGTVGPTGRTSTQTLQYIDPSAPPTDMLDRMKLTGESTTTDIYGRPSSQAPAQERFSPDPRLTQQPQYPGPRPSSPVTRPPPGARVPMPPGYPQDQQVPSPQAGRPPSGYEQGPPDGYTAGGLPVCLPTSISMSNPDLFTAKAAFTAASAYETVYGTCR